jgi:hypothetical protein
MNGLGSQSELMAKAAQAANVETREINLSAVADDLHTLRERVGHLDLTVQKLQDHLMGAQPMLQTEHDMREKEMDRPSPSGAIPAMCMLSTELISAVTRLQERLNQICYQLGEGR